MLLSAAMVAAGATAFAGSAVAAPVGKAPGVSRATAQAVALAFLRHKDAIPWRVLIRDAGAPGITRRVPKPGDASQLEGVFCTTFGNCWAVGFYGSGDANLNLALHWNGKRWAKVSMPNPAGTSGGADNELVGVRCTKPSNCWAVGDRTKPGGPDLNQILHWNGKRWSKVPAPDPGGTLEADFNNLFELFCTSASNCWTVGDYGGEQGLGSQEILSLALRWNGKRWAQVATPNPAGTGKNDGTGLSSVRCSSASNCWAVGTYGTVGAGETLRNLAVHWNGKKWSKVSTPNPGGTAAGTINTLDSLSCTSARNCWSAGFAGIINPSFSLVNEAMHWNGTKWSLAFTPDPDGISTMDVNQLEGISCTTASNCWAVGQYGTINGSTGSVHNQALHWNGKKWSKAPTPNPGGTAATDFNVLTGVHCTSSIHCWAVGSASTGTGPDFAQALRWNGSKWSTG
jgi:hypothetical protein